MLILLAPEIFSLIASHFPLHSRQSSLLSLALTNKGCYDILVPSLLYRHPVLSSESIALSVLQKLLSDQYESSLGRCVRGLHIMAQLSKSLVIDLLAELVVSSRLPHLESLTIYLIDNPVYRASIKESLWTTLNDHCPRLNELALRGDYEAPWIDESGIFEMRVCSPTSLCYHQMLTYNV